MWWRKNRYDPKEALNKIKCPVLSVFGEKDVFVPPAENKHKMEAYLKNAGVDYQIVTIKDCGHDMITNAERNGNWQRQPKEFFNSIFEFIEK